MNNPSFEKCARQDDEADLLVKDLLSTGYIQAESDRTLDEIQRILAKKLGSKNLHIDAAQQQIGLNAETLSNPETFCSALIGYTRFAHSNEKMDFDMDVARFHQKLHESLQYQPHHGNILSEERVMELLRGEAAEILLYTIVKNMLDIWQHRRDAGNEIFPETPNDYPVDFHENCAIESCGRNIWLEAGDDQEEDDLAIIAGSDGKQLYILDATTAEHQFKAKLTRADAAFPTFRTMVSECGIDTNKIHIVFGRKFGWISLADTGVGSRWLTESWRQKQRPAYPGTYAIFLPGIERIDEAAQKMFDTLLEQRYIQRRKNYRISISQQRTTER